MKLGEIDLAVNKGLECGNDFIGMVMAMTMVVTAVIVVGVGVVMGHGSLARKAEHRSSHL